MTVALTEELNTEQCRVGTLLGDWPSQETNMKLLEVRIEKFCNFIDSTPVSVQPDITCFVGKNESGKTAFLQAIYLLNPARPNVSLSVADQYPAWLEKRDRLQGATGKRDSDNGHIRIAACGHWNH